MKKNEFISKLKNIIVRTQRYELAADLRNAERNAEYEDITADFISYYEDKFKKIFSTWIEFGINKPDYNKIYDAVVELREFFRESKISLILNNHESKGKN